MLDKYYNKEFGCRNGAAHDYMCCDTCWNGHPDAKDNDFTFNRKLYGKVELRNFEMTLADFVTEGEGVGFTNQQILFLMKYFRIKE